VNVIAGVLTRDARTHRREHWLQQAVESLAREADQVIVLQNGTTDGSEPLSGPSSADRPGWSEVRILERQAPPEQSRCAHGMNVLLRALGSTSADVIVHSNDDVIWTPGWRGRLQNVWRNAPANLAILDGLVEESFPWNHEYGLAEVNGERMVLRETVPGGAWTMRQSLLSVVLPVPTQNVGFDDLPVCDRLRGLGYDLAAMDLAEHAGAGRSTWGNVAHGTGRPFDWDRWPLTRRPFRDVSRGWRPWQPREEP
jgi:hypothetical protein